MKDLTNAEIVGFNEYRKKTTIKAMQIRYPFSVVTMEGKIEGKAGDWLAEGIAGERYIIDNGIFEKTYELVEEPDEFSVKTGDTGRL